MTAPSPHISRQRDYLFLELAPLGFVIPAQLPPMVAESDPYVINPELGIWVHADEDMVRLVVEQWPDQPGYRLVLGRRDLRLSQSLDIIAIHARAAVADRLGK